MLIKLSDRFTQENTLYTIILSLIYISIEVETTVLWFVLCSFLPLHVKTFTRYLIYYEWYWYDQHPNPLPSVVIHNKSNCSYYTASVYGKIGPQLYHHVMKNLKLSCKSIYICVLFVLGWKFNAKWRKCSVMWTIFHLNLSPSKSKFRDLLIPLFVRVLYFVWHYMYMV